MIGPREIHLSTTRAGRILLPFVCAGITLGWLFGGTSGLFGAALLALVLIAPVLARLHLGGIELALPGQHRATVGKRFRVPLTLSSRARFLAVRDVVIVPGPRGGAEPQPAGFVPCLAPGGDMEVSLQLRLSERGPVRSTTLILGSTFPFGLFRCEATYRVSCDQLGLPRIGALAGRLASASEPEAVSGPRSARFGEEELAGVRDWREGESLRRVHWKLSARRERLIAREYKPRALPEARVLLIVCVETHEPWTGRHPSFEKAVSFAATLVERYLRKGRTVRLALAFPNGGADEPPRWTFHAGNAGLRPALVRLALVEAGAGDPWATLRSALRRSGSGQRRQRRSADTCVVLAGGGRSPGVRPRAAVLDVDDPSTERAFRRSTGPAARGAQLAESIHA